jgi:hypothetical protein
VASRYGRQMTGPFQTRRPVSARWQCCRSTRNLAGRQPLPREWEVDAEQPYLHEAVSITDLVAGAVSAYLTELRGVSQSERRHLVIADILTLLGHQSPFLKKLTFVIQQQADGTIATGLMTVNSTTRSTEGYAGAGALRPARWSRRPRDRPAGGQRRRGDGAPQSRRPDDAVPPRVARRSRSRVAGADLVSLGRSLGPHCLPGTGGRTRTSRSAIAEPLLFLRALSSTRADAADEHQK